MKWILSILLILIFSIGYKTKAQHPSDPYMSDAFPKLMLIPFQPQNYESDVNLSGIMFQKKPRGFVEVNAPILVRQKLEKALFENLLTYFNISRISYYETAESKKDLESIYNSVTYTRKKQKIKLYYKNYKYFNIFKIIGLEKNHWGINCLTDSKGHPIKKRKKIDYTDIEITDSLLIPRLNKMYGCEYYLFINEIEFFTRFNLCHDLMKNVKQKDIVMHFSLIDSKGQKITGGIAAITYNPKNGRNNIIEIADKNMGILANMVTENIRTELNIGLNYFPQP